MTEMKTKFDYFMNNQIVSVIHVKQWHNFRKIFFQFLCKNSLESKL